MGNEYDAAAGMGLGLMAIGTLVTLVIAFIAVKKNRDKVGMGRLAYLGRTVALIVGLIVLYAIALAIPNAFWVLIPVQLVVSYFLYAFAVRRLVHAGWSPWLAFVLVIPAINMLFLLALFIVPQSSVAASEAA